MGWQLAGGKLKTPRCELSLGGVALPLARSWKPQGWVQRALNLLRMLSCPICKNGLRFHGFDEPCTWQTETDLEGKLVQPVQSGSLKSTLSEKDVSQFQGT